MKYIIFGFLIFPLFQSCKSQSELDKILSSNASDFDKVMSIFKVLPDDFEDCNKHQLKVLYVSGLDGQVRNGGFSQFFFNSTGSNTYETLAALKEMNALESAKLLESAIKVFPKLPIKKDTGERRDDMEDMPDEIFDKWDKLDTQFYDKKENLDELIIQYVKSNKENFK